MPSVTTKFAEAKTGVFWDVEDCPILNGLDPHSVYQNIKSALANQGYLGEVSINAYKGKKTIRNDFELAGINLIIAGDRHGRFKNMFEDVLFWMCDHHVSNMLIISRDKTNYTSYLQKWKARGFNILFAEPENPPAKCCNCGIALDKPVIGNERIIQSEEWVWTSLANRRRPFHQNQKARVTFTLSWKPHRLLLLLLIKL